MTKNGADEDASVKGDSPSSTETDSGVSEGCSDNGMSTEEEDIDTANGGASTADRTAGMKTVELTEDLLSNGLAQNMKVGMTAGGNNFEQDCFTLFYYLAGSTYGQGKANDAPGLTTCTVKILTAWCLLLMHPASSKQ